MTKAQFTVLALLLLLSARFSFGFTQERQGFNEVSEYVKKELEATGVPGAALIVVHGDDVVMLETFGVADPFGRPITSETPFVIGSLTKSFTALAVMQLVEEGKLNLDTPVKHYLPYFTLDDPHADEIAVRHTINHTTGISWWDGLGYEGSTDLSAEAIQERIKALESVHLRSEPGSEFAYSNVNYVIAGGAIEALSGQSYETYVKQHIFEPLEMVNSYSSIGEARKNGLAEGYRYVFGIPVASPELPYGRSDLPLYLLSTSIEDMGKYLSAHINGGVYNGNRILSEEGVEALHLGTAATPYNDHYAMGWFDERWNGERVLNHYGSFTGYHANMMIVPERDLELVMLTNAESYLAKERRWEIAKNALRILLGQDIRNKGMSPSLFAFLIVILSILALAIDLIVYIIRRARGQKVKHRLTLRITVGVIFIAMGLAFLYGIPRLFDAPMSSIRLSTPDAGYVFTVAGIVATVWGIIRILLSVLLEKRSSIAFVSIFD